MSLLGSLSIRNCFGLISVLSENSERGRDDEPDSLIGALAGIGDGLVLNAESRRRKVMALFNSLIWPSLSNGLRQSIIPFRLSKSSNPVGPGCDCSSFISVFLDWALAGVSAETG
jgi:hypothetical protein